MTAFIWAKGFVNPCASHIPEVYEGGQRFTWFEGARIYVAICGAWLGPDLVAIGPNGALPECETCTAKVQPLKVDL
jgi:hypothetical protein